MQRDKESDDHLNKHVHKELTHPLKYLNTVYNLKQLS